MTDEKQTGGNTQAIASDSHDEAMHSSQSKGLSEAELKSLAERTMEDLSPKQWEIMKKRLEDALNYQPKVAVFGKTGAGKSSLCNALFGKETAKVSDVEPCTSESASYDVQVFDSGRPITLIDVPGVGESEDVSAKYLKIYKSVLDEVDLVLWVLKTDDRAYEADQKALKAIRSDILKRSLPVVFVLSQAEKMEPMEEWSAETASPGPRQLGNIRKKINYVSEYFSMGDFVVCAVSANKKWQLGDLVHEVVRKLPRKKQISVYRAIKPEHVKRQTQELVGKSLMEEVWDGVKRAAPFILEVAKFVVMAKWPSLGKILDKFRF